MISFVAHEFRTPLNCIISLLEYEYADGKSNIDNLKPILDNARYLLNMSNDILDLA